jgi:hypothetical protein
MTANMNWRGAYVGRMRLLWHIIGLSIQRDRYQQG